MMDVSERCFSFVEDVSKRMKQKDIIGERAKRARHSLVCSIENRGYIIIYILYIVRATFVLITRKVGGA